MVVEAEGRGGKEPTKTVGNSFSLPHYSPSRVEIYLLLLLLLLVAAQAWLFAPYPCKR